MIQLPSGALLTLALVIAALPALADAPPQAGVSRSAYFILTGGLTYGGDTLGSIEYTNGASNSVKAGGLVQFGAGALFKDTNAPVQLELTINYQTSGAYARNQDVTFTRIPIEALVFYTGVPRWRFGAGIRYVSGAKLSSSGNFDNQSIDFKNTTGGIVQIGYNLVPNLWLDARYVSERYSVDNLPNGYEANPVNGDHFGLFATGVF